MKKETKAERLKRWLASAGIVFDETTSEDATWASVTTEVCVLSGTNMVQAIFTRRLPRPGRRASEFMTAHSCFNCNSRRRLSNIGQVYTAAQIATGKF